MTRQSSPRRCSKDTTSSIRATRAALNRSSSSSLGISAASHGVTVRSVRMLVHAKRGSVTLRFWSEIPTTGALCAGLATRRAQNTATGRARRTRATLPAPRPLRTGGSEVVQSVTPRRIRVAPGRALVHNREQCSDDGEMGMPSHETVGNARFRPPAVRGGFRADHRGRGGRRPVGRRDGVRADAALWRIPRLRARRRHPRRPRPSRRRRPGLRPRRRRRWRPRSTAAPATTR